MIRSVYRSDDATARYLSGTRQQRVHPRAAPSFHLLLRHRIGKVVDESAAFASVLPELAKRPAIKTIAYFDIEHDAFGDGDISVDSAPSSLAPSRKLTASPLFSVSLG
jgi:hypothetical protein